MATGITSQGFVKIPVYANDTAAEAGIQVDVVSEKINQGVAYFDSTLTIMKVADGAGNWDSSTTQAAAANVDSAAATSAAVVTLTNGTGATGNDALVDGLTVGAITNYDAVVNMTDPVTKAEGEAVSAALSTLEDEVTAMRADLNSQNDNDSDLADKVIELAAEHVKVLADVDDMRTQFNALQAKMRTAGLLL